MLSLKHLSYLTRSALRWLESRSPRRVFRYTMYGGLLSLFVWVISVTLYKPFSIDIFYERMFFLYGLEDPELMSRLGIADRYGLDFFNGKLTDISKKQSKHLEEDFIQRNLYMLEAYKRSDQTPQQLISTDILKFYLSDQIRQNFIYDQNYLVNHVNGVQVELPRFMIEVHQVRDIHDANNYLKRLGQFSTKIDQLIAELRLREQQGVVAPRFVIDKVLREIQLFLSEDIRNNILYRDFIYKIDNSPSIQRLAESRKRMLYTGDTLDIIYPELYNEIAVVIADNVYPAYQRLYDFLEEQRSKATNIAGAWHLPEGMAYYLIMLQIQTSTDMQPEDLIYLAEEELPVLQDEIKDCLHRIGMDTTRTNVELLNELDSDTAWLYSDDLKGQQRFFKDLRRQIDSTRSLISRFFPDIPPSISFEIRRLPFFRENAAGLLTYESDRKTGRPVVYINMRNIRDIPIYSVPRLAAVILLGMYMPEWYEKQLEDIPTFRRVLPFQAFDKGWQAYINWLLWQEGVFENQPLVKLALLRHELLLTTKMAADIEMNYNQVERQEVVQRLVETTGYPLMRMQELVDKSVVISGINCVSKVGQMHFISLRDMASREIDPAKFDKREFHRFLLKNGGMPLTVLSAQVRKFIEAKNSAE